jgi:hypothetical protein
VCREISVAGGFWWVAAFPATWINIAHGQNAFLTASLAAMGIVSIGRAPILAGVFVGLLSIKPQLGLFFPLALVAARQWKTICSAAITALLFNGLGIAVLGTDAFKAFLNHLSSARTFMEDGSLPWQKMPTLFASSRLIGFSVDASYLIHGIGLAYGAIVVWLVWSRTQRIELRGSALMVATFAGSPFCYDYDLAWLAFPIAWLVRCGLTDGWRRLEREALLLSWLAPLLIAPLAMAASIPLGPPVIAMLLWLTISRLDHAIRPRITPRP